MNWRRSVGPQSELTKAMQPRVRSLDYPAVNSASTAVLGSPTRDHGIDATRFQFFTVRVGVVATVGVQLFRPFLRMANLAFYIGNRVNDVQQFLDIGHVRTGDRSGS